LAPEQCLAFEDSYNGVLSSRGAGLKTIVTINDYTREHDFSDAQLVISDLGEPEQAMSVIQGSCSDSFFSLATAKQIHQS
jgi:beta-phosphoglucomutase-like phosphatase (HAD superfamily)